MTIDWTKWLPPHWLPDTGPKVFKTGQVWAVHDPGDGECMVIRVDKYTGGTVIAGKSATGSMDCLGLTASEPRQRHGILVQDVNERAPRDPAVLYGRAPEPEKGGEPARECVVASCGGRAAPHSCLCARHADEQNKWAKPAPPVAAIACLTCRVLHGLHAQGCPNAPVAAAVETKCVQCGWEGSWQRAMTHNCPARKPFAPVPVSAGCAPVAAAKEPAEEVRNEQGTAEPAGSRRTTAAVAKPPSPVPRVRPAGLSALDISEAVELGRRRGATALLPPDWVDETEVARAHSVRYAQHVDNLGDLEDLL